MMNSLKVSFFFFVRVTFSSRSRAKVGFRECEADRKNNSFSENKWKAFRVQSHRDSKGLREREKVSAREESHKKLKSLGKINFSKRNRKRTNEVRRGVTKTHARLLRKFTGNSFSVRSNAWIEHTRERRGEETRESGRESVSHFNHAMI